MDQLLQSINSFAGIAAVVLGGLATFLTWRLRAELLKFKLELLLLFDTRYAGKEAVEKQTDELSQLEARILHVERTR